MASKNRWFIPTNTENLKMIIAQGLISSPKGFQKYYKDLLEIHPGYILVFKNTIPSEMLKYVTSEDDSLTSCILEIDIKNIDTGTLFALSDEKWVEVSIADIDNSSYDIFLIPAPMPLSTISKVIFKTEKDKKSFEDDAKLYSNLPISEIKLHYAKTDEKLFNPKVSITDISINSLKNAELNILEHSDYTKTYAIGGLLANLFYFAKNGQLSQKILDAWLANKRPDHFEDYGVFDYLHEYQKLSEDSLESEIYAGILKQLIFSKAFKEGMITYLQSDATKQKIANKLIQFDAMSEKPFSEEYIEATTRYGKMLLMLFHRDDTESLIELRLDALHEEDYVVYGMLFGIRDKFIKTPKFIREYNGLQNYISAYMANYYHKSSNTGIEFKTPKKPLSVMQMLKSDRFKEYFAKEFGMEDCFQTVVPKTDYAVVKGKPVFQGIVMPKFEMLDEAYFKAIKFKKITDTDYNKLSQKYQKVK